MKKRSVDSTRPMPVAKHDDAGGLVVLPPPAGSYMMWYDDTAKKSTVQKIVDALGRYEQRFGVAARVAWINPADSVSGDQAVTIIPPDGVELCMADRVPKNNVWVGCNENTKQAR